MTKPPQILALAGSARRASYNKLLVKIAVRGAEAAGVPQAQALAAVQGDVHVVVPFRLGPGGEDAQTAGHA